MTQTQITACELDEIETPGLAFVWHEQQPEDPQSRLEWLIERQLVAAHDTGCPLTVFGARVAPEVASMIERLHGLSEEAYDAKYHGVNARTVAEIDYYDQLVEVAKAVRAGAR